MCGGFRNLEAIFVAIEYVFLDIFTLHLDKSLNPRPATHVTKVIDVAEEPHGLHDIKKAKKQTVR